MHPTEAVTCNQLPIISTLVSAPGSWINRGGGNATPPTHPQSLESYPAEWHFHHHHQWYNRLILGPRGEESSLRWKLDQSPPPPGAKHRCLWGGGGWVQWIIITAQLIGFIVSRKASPVCLLTDLCHVRTGCSEKQTYHHSIVHGSVCRTLSIDDCSIERSLISGFCGGDKWEKQKRSVMGWGENEKTFNE